MHDIQRVRKEQSDERVQYTQYHENIVVSQRRSIWILIVCISAPTPMEKKHYISITKNLPGMMVHAVMNSCISISSVSHLDLLIDSRF